MVKANYNDTIAQISTTIGYGGISIIRISGDKAIDILKKIFNGRIDYKKLRSHSAYYGKILNSNNEVLDEVIVLVMLSPKTYTKEDIVEINCHGGIKSVQKVLALIFENGARSAEPGEFTKRAFLNGRIDLSQAEAVSDIIMAKTDLAHKAALKAVSGELKNEILKIRNEVLMMIAHIEASIDYPEHEMEQMNLSLIQNKSENILQQINYLIKTAEQGKLIRDGIETVIIGKPNVGKSSLLNAFLNEDRAIVTDIPGTTRDILQEYLIYEDIALKITDTAGIRETADAIEKIGVNKTRECIEKADLILVLVDGANILTQEDREIFALSMNKKVILVVNKSDMNQRVEIEELKNDFEYIVHISAKEKTGIKDLYEMVKNLFFDGHIHIDTESRIYKARHKQCLIKARDSLQNSVTAVVEGVTEDLISLDLQEAYNHLGEIIGETLEEDIIDKIFSEFCLGK